MRIIDTLCYRGLESLELNLVTAPAVIAFVHRRPPLKRCNFANFKQRCTIGGQVGEMRPFPTEKYCVKLLVVAPMFDFVLHFFKFVNKLLKFEGLCGWEIPSLRFASLNMVNTNYDSSIPYSQEKKANSMRRSIYSAYGKRVCDLALAIVLAPLVLVPIAVLALLVKRDGGPAFFGHKRIGKGGKEFCCFKLRTMRRDAEEYLERYLAENEDARREWNENYKLRNDPRVTPLGRCLRKTSMDELPQILNVLRGDMSFVGPRPVPARELKEYGAARHAYLVGRPGITGAWQVSGRNELDYATRVAMDVNYRRNESFVMDTIVILKTPLRVLKPTGI